MENSGVMRSGNATALNHVVSQKAHAKQVRARRSHAPAMAARRSARFTRLRYKPRGSTCYSTTVLARRVLCIRKTAVAASQVLII